MICNLLNQKDNIEVKDRFSLTSRHIEKKKKDEYILVESVLVFSFQFIETIFYVFVYIA